ncbi:MAG: hypothetical protein A2V85_04075 [Chloroflexi bacterium RBG_16_72_14]|nr:MAG: hypothetical protein A2V85_04075 [Chloroflexi bacterium RBG_16_72_14]
MTTPPYDSSATEPVAPVQPAAPVQPEPLPAGPEPSEPVPSGPGPVVPRPVRGSPGSSRALNLALGAALLVAAMGVAFAVGRVTAPATSGGTTTSVIDGGIGPGNGLPNDGNVRPGDGTAGRVGIGGGLNIEGTVDSVTADSVTITLESGQTVTVGLDADTTYHQQADATATDVQAGGTVILRLSGGFRIGGDSGSTSLGTASDVTIVP